MNKEPKMKKTLFLALFLTAGWNYTTAQNKSFFCQELSWSPG